MMSASYEFDPCSIDGSDKEVTLDSWTPTVKEVGVPKSEWRQKQNDGNQNQQPGIDELKKINMFLKRKYPDHQIMDAFGITSETLVAIKRECFSPVTGISLDNQSKIYKEFTSIDKKLDRVFEALKFLVDNVFSTKDSAKRMAFKTLISTPKKSKKANLDEDDDEVC